MRLKYLEDIESVDKSEFENPDEAFITEHEEYFRKNTCAMMMNAESDLLKRACIFAVYCNQGVYAPIALQYLLRAGYPRLKGANGLEYFESKTYAEINFWINFYSVLSKRLIDRTWQYFEKEKEYLPKIYVRMFEHIYKVLELNYLPS